MTFLLVIIYLAFISLGLPDSILGSAWPAASQDLDASLAFAGVISMVISAGTVISSLYTVRIVNWLGAGKAVAISVLLTALALIGFALSMNAWMLALLAIPLGLGAGAVDAVLNNFVATHYKSKHMNYLHSFWGVGATAGPLIMAMFLAQSEGWRTGYSTIAYIQCVLVILLFATLKLWQHEPTQLSDKTQEPAKHLSNGQALKISGVKLQLLTFFCYCSLEAATGLWAASYLITQYQLTATTAAFWTAMYYLGITLGRFLSGMIADYVDEKLLIRVGVSIIALGVCMVMLPFSILLTKLGLLLIGLGCAPIYPNTIHLTPIRFGRQASQAIIGLSMAFAYIGTTLIPPLIGYVAALTSFRALPIFLAIFAIAMMITTEKLKRLTPTLK